jgi:hypothetical protein
VKERWPGAGWVALTALAAVLPLASRGNSCGNDFNFHLLSWMEVARDWREGLLNPHWITAANFGAGEPRLIFYPPLSWVLGGGLVLLFGASAAPIVFSWICLFAGGIAMARLARAWLPPQVAMAAACVFAANPYALFVVYERTAYGELAAAALLPALLLFAAGPRVRVPGMAAAFAGIWLADAPAGVIAGYALAWLAVARAVEERGLRGPARITGGALLGLGLAGVYLVPAGFEQRWVQAARAIEYPAMSVGENFLFGRLGDADHRAVLWTVSWIAVVLLAVAAAGWALSRRAAAGGQRFPWRLASFLPLMLFLLLPWSEWFWRHAPEMRFLQFPWRWLMVGAVVAALFAAGALRGLRRGWLAVAAGGLVAGSIAVCATRFYQSCDPEDTPATERATFLSGAGMEGTDEYTPVDGDNSAVEQGLPAVRVLRRADAETAGGDEENPAWRPDAAAEIRAGITVQNWAPERKAVLVDSPLPGFAVLRLMEYPAWEVWVNGQPVSGLPGRADGLMAVPVGAGTSAIDVRWRTTADVMAGRIVSLLALLVWLGMARRRARQRTEAASPRTSRAAA